MRSPSRTQKNSIFEPLFSPDQEELHSTPSPTHLIHSSSSEWLSSTYSASPCIFVRSSLKNQLRKAPTTISKQDMSDIHGKRSERLTSGPHQAELFESVACGPGKQSPSISTDVLGRCRSMPSNPPPSRNRSLGNVNNQDDGSVASKLLTSITKSLSSPSLLSCCKESVRETPYQKTLRLRRMKLQHCAEELGSESSDGALIYSDDADKGSFDGSLNGSSQSLTRSLFAGSSPSTISKTEKLNEYDASPMMISVRSAPNLGCPSLLSRSSTRITKESFPPPLIAHTLPRSASSDSFAFSLRAYREDGRFMLKEVKVPCRQYLQASRKGGRLTLQLITSDEDNEQENSAHKGQEVVTNSQLDVRGGIGVGEGDVSASYSSDHKIGVEFANTSDVEGDFKDSATKLLDDLGMNEFDGTTGKLAFESDVRKSGGLSAKSLSLMATPNADNQGMTDDVCHLGALRIKSNGVERNIENRPSPSYLPNLSSTRHPPKHNPRFKVSAGPLITLPQCEANIVLQSRSTRNAVDTRGVKSMLGLEISSTSLQGTGFGPDRSMSSTIIFKDVGANALMENVSKLVSSFGLDGGKGFKHCHLRDSSRYVDGIRIGVKKVEKRGAQTGNGVHLFNVECERKAQCADGLKGDLGSNWIGIDESSTLQFDLHLPHQVDKWLHNIHCKELNDIRSNFVHKGYPCVAIKS